MVEEGSEKCEADAETGLDVQDTCCPSMMEIGIELGRLGDRQPAMQDGGREIVCIEGSLTVA